MYRRSQGDGSSWENANKPPSSVFPTQCLSGAHFLPHIGTGEESVHTYQQMVQAIDELVRKTFQDWTATLDKDCIRRLDTPLLRISQEKAGMLDVNFDKYRTYPSSFFLSLVPVLLSNSPESLTPILWFLSIHLSLFDSLPLSLSHTVIWLLLLLTFDFIVYLKKK